jgi:hypothetical protein
MWGVMECVWVCAECVGVVLDVAHAKAPSIPLCISDVAPITHARGCVFVDGRQFALFSAAFTTHHSSASVGSLVLFYYCSSDFFRVFIMLFFKFMLIFCGGFYV